MSTVGQDLTARRGSPAALGVDAGRVYVDHRLTGNTQTRPGLREALAACRTGDTLVVTDLDRPARSLPDAWDITQELTGDGVELRLGGLARAAPLRAVARSDADARAVVCRASNEAVERHSTSTRSRQES